MVQGKTPLAFSAINVVGDMTIYTDCLYTIGKAQRNFFDGVAAPMGRGTCLGQRRRIWIRRSTLISVLLILIMVEVTSAKPESAGFKVGQAFPNLILPSLEDEHPLSLAQFHGQKLILQIFASW